jgi:HD-GYP domain-containing protein (c-di-GMP phosphodiesterase class II)
MIKRIGVDQLSPGMFVHDLGCGWLEHPFMRSKFRVDDEKTVRKIVEYGIRELDIDTDRGSDVRAAPDLTEVRREAERTVEREFRGFAKLREERVARSISLDEERRRAGLVYQDGLLVVRDLMNASRIGRRVSPWQAEPVIDRIVESVSRHADALVPLGALKNADSYSVEHAIASASLMAAFGLNLGMTPDELHNLALGAVLQDIGMAAVPADVVEKQAQMTDRDADLIRAHVEQSHHLLQDVGRLSLPTLEVITQHHERIDGSGYPDRLYGDEISRAGQMAAIVDVYDAMTSPRPYRKALPPAEALKKLYEMATRYFDPALVQAFVRTIGIYPVGSLVRLQSGMIGVVTEQTADLLRPRVRLFFNSKRRFFLPPENIEIGKGAGANHGPIVSAESFERWNLDPRRWVPG